MAIQHRRGAYGNFDPSKMRPGEAAVVQSADPVASDGKAMYIAFNAGDVKRLATHDELNSYDQDAHLAAEQAETARANTQRLYELTQQQKSATDQAASAAAASAAAAQKTLDDVQDTINEELEEALETFDEETDETKAQVMAEINERAAEIVAITTNAEEIATEALSVASNTENHLAGIDTQVREIRTALDNVSIDPDDLGLYQDEDTKYVYPTYKGVVSENGIPLASGGGGGGGGGEVINAKLTVTNTSGWLSKTIASGASVSVQFTWSSIEDGMSTGNGAVRISVNDIVRSTQEIQQGSISLDLTSFLSVGLNKVKVRISDVYDQAVTTTFNITAIALSLSSTFDSTTPYTNTIMFPYTPNGAVEKTVHFIVDGREIGTQVTSVSNRQMSYPIPAQTHGAHSLRVYFTAVINNETVRSNELYYEFIYLEPLNNTVIITSNFNTASLPQYTNVIFPFQVYNPQSMTAQAEIGVDGATVATLTVDRTEQSYSIRMNEPGNHSISVSCRGVVLTKNFTVTESEIDVEAETDSLVLHLTAQGRSNNEEHPEVWEDKDNDISATLTGFSFTNDGWQTDENGVTCLRLSGEDRVVIPYKPFAEDCRTTGKTVEIEFKVSNVLDYNAAVISCMSGDRGFEFSPQRAVMKSAQSQVSMQYTTDEQIRVSFVVEKRSENRLFLNYIEGIPSGVVQYASNDDFSQISPVNISIGSSLCTVDIYRIRIYDNGLARHQILNNWIADCQDGTQMLARYQKNNVYDEYGNIVLANLPAELPYYILSAAELPQYKGDKKTISVSFTNRMYPSRSFDSTGLQINVQGTSSAPYARKNYDMQHKEGFDFPSSGHADNYAILPGEIPFNRFVLKADVASQEGANNVELVKLFNDTDPYKTREMQADNRVRWGITGFPIVVFWHNTDTGVTSFLGKYNFNLPKRAPAPYGYTDGGTMESWEFQNNTSDLMLFKTDYFDETMVEDPDTGDIKEAWRYDYEARFPSDEWTDYSNLQEIQSFIYSTRRDEATGDPLPSSVTYDGVTYTNDTADYRLAKFKAEFPSYAELDSFIFYYVFTEFFLMVDSRAKNLFMGFNGSDTPTGRVAPRKATAQPYDMDTGLGTNNEGALVFSPYLEDTDHVSGENVFNGQDSTLWVNLRDAFPQEIRRMYQNLRTGDTFNYAAIEKRFEDHQKQWPEAVWTEDAWFKYIIPLIDPDPGKEATAMYLPMMQGSKEQQRKWWLSNRFAYMDSKWNAGDALSKVIQLRGYAKANITVTPYIDLYPTVKYASYVVQQRGQAGVPATLVCPIDTLSDTEIYIYSAPNLASVGDLSGLKVGLADFSYATCIQDLKLGDASSSYDNQNLYSLTLGSNVLLKTIDVRNCSGLGNTDIQGHTQTTVDASQCTIVENLYFDGTKVKAVILPNGGNVKVLHLPNTIADLTIRNQTHITDLTIAGYSNISTLWLENVNIDMRDILGRVPASTRVRLIGFTWECEDAEEIEDLLDLLDTMRGLDEQGGNMDTAQVSGTIHTSSLTGEQIAAYNARYPYLRVTADSVRSTLTYKSYDGTTVLKEVVCLNGVPQSAAPSIPTRANSSDGHYSYTGIGWSLDMDSQIADPDAAVDVIADRTIYAAYTWVVRTYTVYWQNAGSTIETDTNVPWGTIPHYDGPTPTSGGQTSSGWLPDPTQPITGNTTFVAQYLPIYTITFKNDLGTVTLDTQRVIQGQNATYAGETPVCSEDASLAWLGWSYSTESNNADAVLTNIQASRTVYAAFMSSVEVAEITDSWDTIIAKINNGTAAYKVGNYKPLDLGTEGIVNMQIVGKNQSELASGSGTAMYDWISMELLTTSKRWNPSLAGESGNYTPGTGTIGGWEQSELRAYYKDTLKPLIPANVRNAIKPVKKYTRIYNTAGTAENNIVSTEDVWAPSYFEMNFTGYESVGARYRSFFKTNDDRVKHKVGTSSATYWWLRSAHITNGACRVNSSGFNSYNSVTGTFALALGFSI